MADTAELLQPWEMLFARDSGYTHLIENVQPEIGGCGWVYEIEKLPVMQPNVSAVITIMNSEELPISEPHHHSNGQIEMCMIIAGVGKIVVGKCEHYVVPGSTVTIPSYTAHYTVPHGRLVMAVVNTPAFETDDYTPVDTTRTQKQLGFYLTQYQNNLQQMA